jgi:RNA polymerase sigma-70 factor, ECF subfamily
VKDSTCQGRQHPEFPVFRLRRSLTEGGSAERKRLQEVVGRAQKGERDALRHLYERYADNVYSYVRTIVRDDHAAEDVTQHVFAKLLTKIGSYEQRTVPFAAWLLRIARNCAIDHLRSRRTIYCDEVPAVEPAEHQEIASERRHALHDALQALPDRQRHVIMLRHVVGLSPPEIAAQMGKTEGAIHTLHHRARRALQQELLVRGTAPVAVEARSAPA